MWEDNNRVYPVAELNKLISKLLETELPLIWVRGEVSNFVRAASGHWYFSLKDSDAQIRCVMFRFKNQLVAQNVNNGTQVEVLANATLYEARGDLQLTVEQMRLAGVGALFERFEQLKQQLQAQGWFAQERKRPLPNFPCCVGIVTSPQAAALKDVLTTLKRRYPKIPVVLYPSPVQGVGSEHKISAAIQLANQRKECDVLIVCRGGGSIEDLWAFNEMVVASAIAASAIPVISGVGHETDFTIADFVADQRAATPTAAAQMAVPDRMALNTHLNALNRQLARLWLYRWQRQAQHIDYLQRRLIHPAQRIQQQYRQLDDYKERLQRLLKRQFVQQQNRLDWLQQRLLQQRTQLLSGQIQLEKMANRLIRAYQQQYKNQALCLSNLAHSLEILSPHQVMQRGYSLVQTEEGCVVRDATELTTQQKLQLYFAHGQATVRVDKVN